MHGPTLRVPTLAAFVTAAAALLPGHAAGGEFRLSPYLWAAGFTGTLGVPSSGGSVPGWDGDRLDVTFDALRENLKIAGAGMLHAEWRDGRLSVSGDWVYVSLDATTPSALSPLYTNAEGAITGNVGQADLGWRIWGTDATRLDAYGGVRYYDLHVTAGLTAGTLKAVRVSGADTWVDGLAGLRLDQAITERWRLVVAGDLGAGGSDQARQAVATVAYRTPWGAIGGGWRLLRVDRATADFRLDATLSGPLFGATFKF